MPHPKYKSSPPPTQEKIERERSAYLTKKGQLKSKINKEQETLAKRSEAGKPVRAQTKLVSRLERQYDEIKKSERKRLNKVRAEERRQYYQQALNELKATGLYSPKSDELTPYRKRRINRAERQYSGYLSKEDWQFIPVKGPKKKRQAILKSAEEQAKLKTTKKGVFVRKPKYGETTGARFVYDKNLKEWKLQRRIKYRRRGTSELENILLMSPANVLRGRERVRRMIKDYNFSPKDRVMFSFTDEMGHSNTGRNYYKVPDNIEQLFEDIERYRPDDNEAQAQFYTTIYLNVVRVDNRGSLVKNKVRPPTNHRVKKLVLSDPIVFDIIGDLAFED